ncbi:response regulator transcription factor [Couchioplanes caeruleus]|uniref:Helix-turn-helix transcriptional regulator n=2 Tax=Couchioplanes caeruleus TaxID=56438 RepID=A0A1K0FQU0_9ACTN|nr:response regulator transcription factor [Couchioplanes caeruleus]OJF15153.1 helix-turn-helix transcriptional regulator [Couchioplanes caeruleus subsp. caeruleus]ROP28676.1 LuxR family two component transcriptional regulator [Couchioplanes caeruleus]
MIRILLAEPMNLLRGALAATLSLEEDLDVVADLGRLDEVLPMARAVSPDVAVINTDLLADPDLRVVGRMNLELPHCGILLLACADAPARLSRTLDTGVRGFIDKQAGPRELAYGIRQAARGERVMDARLAVAVLAAPRNPLSPRERDVLVVAASGAPSQEIAAKLHLTAGTVRNYISAILRKTGARNRLEAVRIAEEAGWLD